MKNLSWYHYVALILIVFSIFYFSYYKPKSKEVKNFRTDRTQVEEDVRKSRVKKRQLDKIEAELKSMNKTLEELEAIIPQKKEISDILRKIQQLALDSQLNITRFQPQGEIPKEFFSEWPILIEITGNYLNLRTFFNRLIYFSRLFTIENFAIQSLPRQSDEVTISVSCTAKTYIFHEEALENAQGKKTKGNKA